MTNMNQSEPTYTYDGYALAGAHPRPDRTYRVTDTERVSITGLHSVVGSTDVVALPERETVAQAADMVRRALDVTSMTASQLLPIVRQTCGMIHDPRETVYRSAAMSLGIGSGDVDAVMSSADPWQARQHAVKVTRSRKGRTSFERVGVSMAPVIGDRHAPVSVTDESITDEACQARDRAALSLMGARRLKLGTNALDVQRATDQHYRSLGLPALVGSDATSWATGIGGDRTSRTSVASHRAGIDGTASDTTANDLAAPGGEYVAHTGDKLDWSPRLTLKRGRARDLDPTDTRVFVVASNGDIAPHWSLIAPAVDTVEHVRSDITPIRGPRVIVKRSSLATLPYRRWTVRPNVVTYAPRSNASTEHEQRIGLARSVTSDHRWSGHALVKRPDVKRSTRKTNRAAATDIGKVSAPTSAQGWREILDNLNRGEKLTATSDTGRVTITRNSQCYVANDDRGDERVTWRKRSADSLAEHLATV